MGTRITHKEKKLVLENFTSLSALQALNYLLPLIVLPYLIRVIGPEKFGLIAFAQSLIQYFMIITDYGFSLSASRKISLCGDEKSKVCAVFSSVMTVKFILAALSFLILAIIVRFVPKFKNDWMVYILSFGAVVGNTLFPVWFFQGKEKMKYIAQINIIVGMVYTACIFLLVRKQAHYLRVPLLNSLFFLTTGISGLFIAFRRFDLQFIFQTYKDIRAELKAGWSIFISIVAINAYTATRIFAVGLLTNNTLTGFYSIAEKIANFIQTFPLGSFSQAIYPRLIKIFARNKERALHIMNRIQTSTTFAYLIILPIFFFSARLIVRVICGPVYPEVVIALRLLLVGLFFVVANAFRVQFLLVCGKTSTYSKLHVIGAIAGLPLIFLLTYFTSYKGAAISTIIIESAIFLMTAHIIGNLTRKLLSR